MLAAAANQTTTRPPATLSAASQTTHTPTHACTMRSAPAWNRADSARASDHLGLRSTVEPDGRPATREPAEAPDNVVYSSRNYRALDQELVTRTSGHSRGHDRGYQ